MQVYSDPQASEDTGLAGLMPALLESPFLLPWPTGLPLPSFPACLFPVPPPSVICHWDSLLPFAWFCPQPQPLYQLLHFKFPPLQGMLLLCFPCFP